MNREKSIQLLIFFVLIFIILFSFLIGFLFDGAYTMIILIAIICGCAFSFILLYLRIQHNIDRKFESIQKNEKQIYREIVDFLENFLDYLSEGKKESGDVLDKIDEKFAEIKDFQNKTFVLNQKQSGHQKGRAESLNYGVKKLKNDSGKKGRKN